MGTRCGRGGGRGWGGGRRTALGFPQVTAEESGFANEGAGKRGDSMQCPTGDGQLSESRQTQNSGKDLRAYFLLRCE